MTTSLEQCRRQRARLLRQLVEFGDFRPGSISKPTKRCGKPSCHCAKDGDSGHPGRAQFTAKVAGKTVTESLPSRSSQLKAKREIGEYRRFQQWSSSFVEVNIAICRLRPVEEDMDLTSQEKNGRSDPTRSRRRSRSAAASCVRRTAQQRCARS
jgi:hypothetical protein